MKKTFLILALFTSSAAYAGDTAEPKCPKGDCSQNRVEQVVGWSCECTERDENGRCTRRDCK